MSDIITNITSGAIGAFIVIFLKELFTWKGQGRTEAIIRYETLLTECYGRLLPLIDKLENRGNLIDLKRTDYDIVDLIYNRFSFRFPKKIEEALEKFLWESNYDGDFLQFSTALEAKELLLNLSLDLRELSYLLKDEIRRLESYTQSIKARIGYILFVWDFKSKKIIG